MTVFSSPPPSSRILLHSCCAPCSGGILSDLKDSGIETTVFYYNPNVHPQEEYERRKNENKRFADKLGIPFVDADYDPDNWFARIKGLEDEPERGARCSVCFLLRMEKTALYAHENGFEAFATTLGLSRHKDQAQVYVAGRAATTSYPELAFWDCNWRKNGGVERCAVVARQEAFYRQSYCGCLFSCNRLKSQ